VPLALKNDGTVWAFGRNDDGQLGTTSNGTCTPAGTSYPCSKTPVQVKGAGGSGFLTNVVAIAAGHDRSLALKSDGSVWGWGYNGFAETGAGSNTPAAVLTPVQVVGPNGTGFLSGVSAIAARGYFSMALKSDGTVWAWGANGNGELGQNFIGSGASAPPVLVVGPGGSSIMTSITAIASDHDAGLALKSDGSVWTWGENDNGQAGTNTLGDNPAPAQVLGPGGSGTLSGVTAIAGGVDFSLALKSDGTVRAWGDDGLGELGSTAPTTCNTNPCSLVPQQTQGLTGSMGTIGAGGYFSLAAASSTTTRLASTTYS
jgi:alpha-tubulin suppressor-like RCC1 family protein